VDVGARVVGEAVGCLLAVVVVISSVVNSVVGQKGGSDVEGTVVVAGVVV